ncbi:MAG: hypothetical protein RI884_1171 [Pseudomonadota bacterium]|jgi:hypothetical protein
MAASTGTGGAGPVPPAGGEPALRWHHLLRCTCEHLGITASDTDRIVEEQALQVGGIDLALHLNAPGRQGEFYADCGRPEPWQEADVYQQLLQEALSHDWPSITLALHPQSRHIVAKACLPLSIADEDGWLCTTLMLVTIGRALDIRQRFTLLADGHH